MERRGSLADSAVACLLLHTANTCSTQRILDQRKGSIFYLRTKQTRVAAGSERELFWQGNLGCLTERKSERILNWRQEKKSCRRRPSTRLYIPTYLATFTRESCLAEHQSSFARSSVFLCMRSYVRPRLASEGLPVQTTTIAFESCLLISPRSTAGRVFKASLTLTSKGDDDEMTFSANSPRRSFLQLRRL